MPTHMKDSAQLDELEKPDASEDLETRLRALEEAENAINAAFMTGKADRAAITKIAQDEAQEAIRMVGDAIEADEAADEAGRLAVIAENMGNRDKTRLARKNAREARRTAKETHRAATRAAKGAYDSIKFSQPGKLGFMRVVQVAYAINVVSLLFMLVLTSRDTITYDSYTILDWINAILQGVGFWFFVNYFKITKRYVIFTSVFGIASFIIANAIAGTLSLAGALWYVGWDGFLILYFSLSKRVNAVLVNDFSTYRPSQSARDAQVQVKRSGWPFVRNLIMYFVIFSILGHWMEAGMCQFIRLGWVQGEYDPTNTMLWRDWLYPYPMEGAAVVIIALVLYPLWQFLLKRFSEKPILAYVISFFANALTCSLIEFSMGLLVNANHQLWDYSDMPGNILGQVCLQNTAAFGVAASLIAWVVYPMLERWLARIPNDTMNIAFVVVAVIGGILWSLYIIDPPENHTYEAPTPEQLAQQSREGLWDPIDDLADDADELDELLNGDSSKNLPEEEREAVRQQLETLKHDVDQLKTLTRFQST